MPLSSVCRLTDTQLVVLSRAAQRTDGRIALPDHVRSSAAERVIHSLLIQRLIHEVAAPIGLGFADQPSDPIYAVTKKGLAAIGLEPEDASLSEGDNVDRLEDEPAVKEQAHPTRDAVADETAPKPRKRQGRPTKQAGVLALMRAAEGGSLDAIMAATGWQAHTTRAVVSGFRKRGLNIERLRDQSNVTRYRIVEDIATDDSEGLAPASVE